MRSGFHLQESVLFYVCLGLQCYTLATSDNLVKAFPARQDNVNVGSGTIGTDGMA